MKLTVLTDNNTLIDQYYLGEPAVSYYIQLDGANVLFDAGYSDVAVKNAVTLGIDLATVTHIVLSHGHDDHTRGLQYLPDITHARLIAHPDCFLPKYLDGHYIGTPFDEIEAAARFDYVPSSKPYWVTDDCVFLGGIPRVMEFEPPYAIGERITPGGAEPDLLCEDSALAYKTDDGIFIITGCSHSGLCNIIERAKAVCGDERITGVLGGFHLFEEDARLDATAEYLAGCCMRAAYPCHCVSLAAKAKLLQRLGNVQEVGAGMTVII